MLIRPGALFDGEKLTRHLMLRIEDGRIADIGEELLAHAGESVLDAKDTLVSPGFIDIHIHGIAGHDTMNGEAHVRHMSKCVAQHGVTGFLPTTMAASFDDTRSALQGVARAMGTTGGARVLGCHLEGPFLNPLRKGAQPAQYIVPPSLETYEELTDGLTHAVKLMTLAPEMPGALALMDALNGQIALSAGHTDAAADQIEQATAHGLTQITHLFNGMNALGHRTPGVPGAALALDALSIQLICDLLHVHRDVLRLCYLAKRTERVILITDAMEATDMPDGEYTLGANPVFMRGGEARLAQGNLAGSTLTMERALGNMVHAVGVPLVDALQMATVNPAQSIGLNQYGVLKPGVPADLVFLSPDIDVLCTLVGGQILYQRKEMFHVKH